MKGVIGNNDAVPGTEAVWYITGEIQMLFDEDNRVGADLLCRLILLHDKLNIAVSAFFHLIRVIFRCRASASLLQSLLQLVFAQSVCGSSFFCRF